MDFLDDRLAKLRRGGTYRSLPLPPPGAVDFWSNDYLGLARTQVQGRDREVGWGGNGATGSRLISGNSPAALALEERIAAFHGQSSALLFGSGYAANLGLLSALLRRGDVLLYDELMHASCRDGIRLGQARSWRFRHNDPADLARLLGKHAAAAGQTFVLTEGRFSMDGDVAPLAALADLCRAAGAHLVVDEAHSGGLDGPGGRGLVAALGPSAGALATVVTYGKAFGSHGAAVLGTERLRDYLVNTCRPFIYSTGLAPAQVRGIRRAYDLLERLHGERYPRLLDRIARFREAAAAAGLTARLGAAAGPIQTVAVAGNDGVMRLEATCRAAGLLIKGVRSPTVAAGRERIRICLHAFDELRDIERLVSLLVRQLATTGPTDA